MAVNLTWIADNLVDGYIADCNVAEDTKRAYRGSIALFGGYLSEEGIPLESLSEADLIRFAARMESLLSDGYASSVVSTTKRFLQWLEAEGVMRYVGHRVPCPKVPNVPKRSPLSPLQVDSLLRAAESLPSPFCLREKAMIRLSLFEALTPSEILGLDVRDLKIEPPRSTVLVKGIAVVPLTSGTANALRAYLEKRGPTQPDSPLFVSHSTRNGGARLTARSFREVVGNTFEMAGLEGGLSSYSLKLTAIYAAKANGVPDSDIADLGRFRSISTHRKYEAGYRIVKQTPQDQVELAIENMSPGTRSGSISVSRLLEALEGMDPEGVVEVSVSAQGEVTVNELA